MKYKYENIRCIATMLFELSDKNTYEKYRRAVKTIAALLYEVTDRVEHNEKKGV
ncbi:MAG: hypothetical protein [Arizlama microvirus]|nr:MAG: hypothetical protein [Arizlama microvirus]